MLNLWVGLLFASAQPAGAVFPFQGQLYVQFSELFQESAVWEDAPVLEHLADGINHGHVLVNHQVG